MMKVLDITILILLILINIVLIYQVVKSVDNSELERLELKVDSISKQRDSIQSRIDTVTIKIENTKKYYKETVNTIINNSTDADLLYFRGYLTRNKARLDSLDNF